MNKHIVITSINYPTKAIELFSKKKDFTVVVVGDKKTPSDWKCANVIFLSVDEQEKKQFALSKKIPYNHYSRKMMGYLYAIENGSNVIYDTDDDNIPQKNWKQVEFNGFYDTLKRKFDFVNIYRYFSNKKIWPRGFPLEKILKDEFSYLPISNTEKKHHFVGIWQSLADGDPDVDAIYRLIINEECIFDKRPPIVLDKYTLCPFNSQSTFFSKQCFPLLYIPATVSFRFCDILRGLVAQPIMWNAGLSLGFTEAIVYQERNFHNYMDDFRSEIPMFENVSKIASIVGGAIKKDASIKINLLNAYQSLCVAGVVQDEEMQIVSAWIEDLESLNF